jgi:hypothetical protein
MMYVKQVSRNKAIEMIALASGWPCIFDLTTDWTTKSSGQDHWGFKFCFVLFGIKVLEFNFYDIRHNDDGEE